MKYIIMIMSALLILSCNQKVLKEEIKQAEVLATWRGGQLTASEFDDYLATGDTLNKDLGLTEYKTDSIKNRMETLITSKLILQLADSLKLDTIPGILGSYNKKLYTLAMNKLYEDSVTNKVISQEDINNLINKNKHIYRISHILHFKNTKQETKIDSLYSVLKEQPEKFTEFAEKFSDDSPTAKNGGDLGWFKFNELPAEEFKDAVDPDKKDQVLKPFDTKFGRHIIYISEIKTNNEFKSDNRTRQDAIKYLKNKYDDELTESDMKFKAFLFRLHNIEIDTMAIDYSLLLYNFYKLNGYNVEEKLRDIWKSIEFVNYSFPDAEFIYSLKSLVQIFQAKPEIKVVRKNDVIETIYSVLAQRLTTSAVTVLGYNKHPSLNSKTENLMIKEYKEYIIKEKIINKIVEDFEQGRLKTFPTLKDIIALWIDQLYNDYKVSIKVK